MRDVLRWSPIMTPSPGGTFVSNHDYAMLQEECDRLRAAVAAREPQAKAVAWEHAMDNTEGIPGNRPQVLLTYSPANPFGRPGVDYSESFSVTSRALVYADATHYPVAQSVAVPDVPTDPPQAFIDYMMDNYPPGCRIQDAAWHAPKVWRAARRAMLAAAPSAQKVAVPDGFVMVPVEPTAKMVDAGVKIHPYSSYSDVRVIYRNMLAAAKEADRD